MQTSTVHGLPRPNLPAEGVSDSPLDLPQLFHDRDVIIDLMAKMPSGNLADRPAAGNVHRFFIVLDQADSPRVDWDNGSSWVTIYPARKALVTALPGSPYDGQEIVYSPDETDGILWHLRYNAGSASAYKWEFIGGSDLYARINGPTAIVNGDNQDKGGPTVTVPVGGDFDAEFGAGVPAGVPSGRYTGVGLSVAGVASVDSSTIVSGGGSGLALMTKTRAVASPAGDLKVIYSSNTSIQFNERWISVRPVRIG